MLLPYCLTPLRFLQFPNQYQTDVISVIINMTKSILNTLYETELKGDNLVFKHKQEVGSIMEVNRYYRIHSNNGWSPCRKFRKIATIPMIELLKNSEILKDADGLRKFLKSDRCDNRYLIVEKRTI